MNSVLVQSILAGPVGRNAPAREGASPEETAVFRDMLSATEEGGRQRRRKDVAETPSFGRLAERLSERVGHLPAEQDETAAATDSALKTEEETSSDATGDHGSQVEAGPDDLASADASAPPLPQRLPVPDTEPREPAKDAASPDPQDIGAAAGSGRRTAAANFETGREMEPAGRRAGEEVEQQRPLLWEPAGGRSSTLDQGKAGRNDDGSRDNHTADARRPRAVAVPRTDQNQAPPSRGSEQLIDGNPVTLAAVHVPERAMSRTGAGLVAAIGRAFVVDHGVEERQSTELPPDLAAAEEPHIGMEAAHAAEPRGSRGTALRDASLTADEGGSALRHGAGETAEPASARLDGLISGGLNAAPAMVRPSVTAASVLGPLTADPVLRAAIARPELASDPHDGTARPAHSLRIQLSPIELGAVTATLRMTDDRLSVEMTTENVDAFRQLSRESDTIVAALRSLGLQVDQVTIQPPQSGAGASSRNEGGMPLQNGGGGDSSGRAGGSSSGNHGAQGGNHSNEGGRNGASRQSSVTPVRDARAGGDLVI